MYGIENTKEKKGDFILFDETEHHYDIQQMTLFIAREKELLDGADDMPDVLDAAAIPQQTGVASGGQNDEYAERERKKAEEMLDQILDRISRLAGKIPAEQYDLLCHTDIKNQIYLLDSLADKATAKGNYLLSVEIENVKSFLIHRCFVGDEIREIEAECNARRSA